MKPDPLVQLTASELRRHLRSGEVSAVEVLRATFDWIDRLEPKLHAWVHLARERALAEAAAVDAAADHDNPRRPLAGVPLGVKDIFNTQDLPTEMGSPIWTGFTPGNDARVVFNLRQAGAIVIGKTVTAEFAVHYLRETIHPLDATRNPGTSSTGSAVAVATWQVPLALGTQTAGSIVRPASYCGVYGFKPSFGLIPRTGMLKTTDSLDTVGYLARSVEDLRLMFEVVRVRGADYPLSDAALSDARRQQKSPDRRWRVALVKPHTWELTHGYARSALEAELARWQASGLVDVVEKTLPPSTREAHDIHSIIYDKTLAYYFKEEFKKAQLISPIFKEIIEHGQQTTLDEYLGALERQKRLMRDFDAWFGDVDAAVTLSVAGEAPLRDEAERRDSALLFTLAGLPVVSMPALVGPSHLPIGAQVVARRYNDYLLLGLLGELAHAGLAPIAPHPTPTFKAVEP
jgi:Asp-tRNA(Asn)/Glu-tRNA(Gln) amidotransferase A subunit family amidase